MAIQKHLEKQHIKNTQTTSLNGITQILQIIDTWMSNSFSDVDKVKLFCKYIIETLASVQMPRELESIALQSHSGKIAEFFQWVRTKFKGRDYDDIANCCLKLIYGKIIRENEPSSLVTIGLVVIHDDRIQEAVAFMSQMSSDDDVVRAASSLIHYLRIEPIAPVHIWILQILTSLYEKNEFGTLQKIIHKNLTPLSLTLLIQILQPRVFPIFKFMMEIATPQNFDVVSQRLVKLLENLKIKKSDIFELSMDVLSNFMSRNNLVGSKYSDIVRYLILLLLYFEI